MNSHTACVLPIFLCGMLVVSQAAAWKKDGIESIYPTAISVQVSPSQTSSNELRAIKEAGFEYVRFGVRPPGTDTNQDLSILLTRLYAVQLKPIITLFGGPDVWTQSTTSTESLTPLEAAEKFAMFSLSKLSQYDNPDILWELWNEPDVAIFLKPELLRSALVPSIKKICDSSVLTKGTMRKKIIGFGFGREPYLQPNLYENYLLVVSLTSCLTGVSVHPYRLVPETVVEDAVRIRFLLQKYGRAQLPVIATEWGYANFAPTRDQGGQAELILREYLSTVLAGIPLLNIYRWKDAKSDPKSIENNYGLVDSNGQPKKALPALTFLLSKLRDTQLGSGKKVGQTFMLTLNSQASAKETRIVYVVWDPSPYADGQIVIPKMSAKHCIVSEFYPQQSDIPCQADGDTVKVNAGSVPVAVTLYF